MDDQDQLTVSLFRAPVDIPNARRARPLGCAPGSMPPWNAPNAVKTHGSQLFQKLTAAHPAIGQVLTTALQTPGATPSFYFNLLADDAERLCWETLYEQHNGFLALQQEWAIARMADSTFDIVRPPVAIFDSPLRLMAILSAHNVPAEPEWQQLKAEVIRSRNDQACPVELSLLIGEEALFGTITQEIANEHLPGITVAPMPMQTEDIKKAVNAFSPHILHFFTHGSVDYGSATLQMGHFGDAGLPNGSISLSTSELTRFAAMKTVWLVTLNCCDSGRAVPEMHSMAHRLVAQGVPAALGMMEPIAPADAHELCGAFYRAIFEYLVDRLKIAPGDQVEVEWSKVLHPARSALKTLHIAQGQPDTRREWTLPVLYVRIEPFYVSRGNVGAAPVPAGVMPPVADVVRRVETVAGFLRALPPDAPAEMRRQALAILADVTESLRPDSFGMFRTPEPLGNGAAAGSGG
jgi:hypothetical protein